MGTVEEHPAASLARRRIQLEADRRRSSRRLHKESSRRPLFAQRSFVCPLAAGGCAGGLSTSDEGRFAQFTFVSQLTPLDVEATPESATLPTLGPGQYFEADDAQRPDTGRVHGDEEFGWADIKGNPALALVWTTDETGAHYLVVDRTSAFFLGTLDPETNERANDGFQGLVEQMDVIQADRISTASEGIGSGAALLFLAWGLGLCPETGGAGCIAGVVGAGAVALGNSVRNFVRIQQYNHDLRLVRESLADKFSEATSSTQP